MLHHRVMAMSLAENDVPSRNSSWAETWPHTGHGKMNRYANKTPSALIQTKQYYGIVIFWWLFFPHIEKRPQHMNDKTPYDKTLECQISCFKIFFLIFFSKIFFLGGFPWGSAGKESTCNAGDLGSIPGLGRSLGKRKSYPFQYSGLENSMDCIVHGVAKSWTRLSNSFTFTLNPQGWFLNSLHHHLK